MQEPPEVSIELGYRALRRQRGFFPHWDNEDVDICGLRFVAFGKNMHS
jgi:hypothetical protein